MNKLFLALLFLSFLTLSSCKILPFKILPFEILPFKINFIGNNEDVDVDVDVDGAAINVQHRDIKARTSSDNYTRLGAAYLSKNNYEKALVKLQKALKLNDRSIL